MYRGVFVCKSRLVRGEEGHFSVNSFDVTLYYFHKFSDCFVILTC